MASFDNRDDAIKFHASFAAAELHWFERGQWRNADDRDLKAWDPQGESIEKRHGRLWKQDLDASDAPLFRWFRGGRTNAAFNEVLHPLHTLRNTYYLLSQRMAIYRDSGKWWKWGGFYL